MKDKQVPLSHVFLRIFNSIYFSAKCTRFVKNKNEIRLSASRAPHEGKLRGASLDLHLYWHARIYAKRRVFIDNA